MKLKEIVLITLLSSVFAFGLMTLNTSIPNSLIPPIAPKETSEIEATKTKESLLTKVKKAGKIRCGYTIWPPALMKDPNTGEMSGMVFDLMEEIGKQLDLKIEWTAESVPAHIFSDIENGRVDMVCAPYFITPSRAREGGFSAPILYHPSYLYVRADDTRFDNNHKAANDQGITFAIMDGEFSAIATKESFPKAKTFALPQNATGSELMLAVTDKKADALITEQVTFSLFNANNPNKIKRAEGAPVRVLAASLPMPSDEPEFNNMINYTLNYLHGIGFIEKLFEKYETDEIKFLRMTTPYKEAE